MTADWPHGTGLASISRSSSAVAGVASASHRSAASISGAAAFSRWLYGGVRRVRPPWRPTRGGGRPGGRRHRRLRPWPGARVLPAHVLERPARRGRSHHRRRPRVPAGTRSRPGLTGTPVPGVRCPPEDSTWHVHLWVTSEPGWLPSVRRKRTHAHREEGMAAIRPDQAKTDTIIGAPAPPETYRRST